MDDLASAISMLAALSGLPRGPFQRLREQLPAELQPTSPVLDLFTIGMSEGDDAGAAVSMTAVRGDGRMVVWLVEACVYPTGPGNWSMNVKAEIDLDDRSGDDRCVLNEQEIVTDAAAVTGAIDRAVEVVTGYPKEDLLTAGWEPPDWDGD